MKIRFFHLAVATFWLSAAFAAHGGGRISVLDMGIPSGVDGAYGCPTAPQSFVRALGVAHDVRIVNHAQAVEEGAFDNERTELLVIPSGALFPQCLATNLTGFLKRGGLMLTCGGYAFDAPRVFSGGEWRKEDTQNLPSPVCCRPVSIPPPSAWIPVASVGSRTVVENCVDPEGHPGVKISTSNMLQYNQGEMPVSAGTLDGAGAIAFMAKSDSSLKSMRVGITERDGSRWHADIPASVEWAEQVLTWDDFKFFEYSPTKGKRGGDDDRVRFDEVKRIVFAFIGNGGNPTHVPHSVCVSDIRFGVDPLAEQRRRRGAGIWINTRNYPSGFWDEPRPDQIGAFSPFYRLEGVSRMANDPATSDLFAPFACESDYTGWDASAVLSQKINGHAQNRAAYRPVLACRSKDGELRGRAASLVHHYDGFFKGSSWALFGVDNADLFASGMADAFLVDVVDALFRRVYLAVTTPEWACYYPGEMAEFSTRVKNFSAADVKGLVAFTLVDESGQVVRRVEIPVNVSARSDAHVVSKWHVPEDANDFYRITAELVIDGKTVDRETTAIAVWKAETIASGPKIGRDGTYFTVDGRRTFLSGAQMFLARQASHTAGSALRFYEDFKAIQNAGFRLSRNFFGFWPNTPKGEQRRIVRLMDACVLLSQKFGIVNYFTPFCDNVIPLDDEGRRRDAGVERYFADRYRDVPGFMMDVRNEPRIERRPGDSRNERDLGELFVEWSRDMVNAAHQGRPSVLVATGWAQGWSIGNSVLDPPTAALPFDFTDMHYYGGNSGQVSALKKVDHRILGKPAVMGEFGCAYNPARIGYAETFADIAEASRRYRCQAVRAFGLGYAAMCHYGWTDLIEGYCPFGLCRWDGNPRETERIYAKINKAFSRLVPVENAPDTVLVISDLRFDAHGRKSTLAGYNGASEALAWWGVNFSVLPESEKGSIPSSVKLVVSTDDFSGGETPDPFSDAATFRAEIGRRIREAGVSHTRREGDPLTLETYRVPGAGATAWVFWNGDAENAVTVERDGHQMTIGPERGGYLQVSDKGGLDAAVEL